MSRFHFIFAACVLMACGEVAEGPEIASGIDGDKRLTELSVDEEHQLCRTVLGGLQTHGSPYRSCEYRGVVETSDKKSCRAVEAECVAELEKETVDLGHCEEDFALPEGCDATIDEYEACLNAVLIRWDEAFGSMTCGNADEHGLDSMKDLRVLADEALKSAACAPLQARCPMR